MAKDVKIKSTLLGLRIFQKKLNMTGLKKLVNNMPKAVVRLCEVNNQQVNEAPPFELLISDHDIIVGKNRHGVFATWNILNPDSPVSPGFAPAGITGLRCLHHEAEKQEHIILVAKMVVDLMKCGVDAVALQEVPANNNHYFTLFVQTLARLAEENNIVLGFDGFHRSYAQTKKPVKNGVDRGYHGFATALLFKEKSFILNEVTLLPGERGTSCSLFSTKSNENLTIINIHGDYGLSDSLASEIVLAINSSSTMVLGDTNIALTEIDAVAKLAEIKGVVVESSSNIAGTPDSLRTLGCFVTNIPTRYVLKKGCNNFATTFFAHKQDYLGDVASASGEAGIIGSASGETESVLTGINMSTN